MATNKYIARLKAQLDQAIVQREHWKQLAGNRNSIVVTEVCPESRSVEEYIIDADSVRASWRLIRRHREQIEALRLQNAMFVTAAANIDREREALRAELAEVKASGWRNHSVHYARAEKCPQTLETAQAAWDRDQELIEEQRAEINRHKQTINQLCQRRPAQPK